MGIGQGGGSAVGRGKEEGGGERDAGARARKSQDLPGGHDVVDVDVLDEGLQLRALFDLVLAHFLRHLKHVYTKSAHDRRSLDCKLKLLGHQGAQLARPKYYDIGPRRTPNHGTHLHWVHIYLAYGTVLLGVRRELEIMSVARSRHYLIFCKRNILRIAIYRNISNTIHNP